MTALDKDCRKAEHALLIRDALNAAARIELDLHLRRCDTCRDGALGLERLERAAPVVSPLDTAQQQAIYRRLVPAVHALTQPKPVPFGRRDFWQRLFGERRTFALSASFVVATLAVVLATVYIGLRPATAPSGTQTERFAAAAARELERPGLVDRCEGAVLVDGQPADGVAKLKVRQGSRITTTDSSRFSFRIGDFARVALFGGSEWRLAELSETFLSMELTRGRLAVEFDGTTGQVMEVATPATIVRVKGTTFTVEALSEGQTRVGVIEGLVDVVPRYGASVEVSAGQLVAVPDSLKPTPLADEQRELAAELSANAAYPEELTRVIHFDGSPEKAKVELDGRVVGTTPLAVRVPNGPVSYRLTAPGMQAVVGTLENRSDSEDVRFALAPKTSGFGPFEVRADAHSLVRVQPRSALRQANAVSGNWDLLKRARAAVTAGDIPFAIKLLEQVIGELDGEHAVDAFSLLAECYGAVGRYSEAAETFDRIATTAAGSTMAQNARYEVGRLTMDRLGDLSRARSAFTAYVASPLGGALKEEAYYSLCELDAKEAPQNAIDCFNEFLRAYPGGHHEPDARLWRGALYQDIEQRWVDAERDLLSFVSAKPSHPAAEDARYRVIVGRSRLHDLRGALRMIDQYLAAHPNGQHRERIEKLKRSILSARPSDN